MPTFATFIQHSIGILKAVRQGKETKGTQIGKEEVKLSLFSDDMVLYINPGYSTKKTVRTNE